MMKVAQKEIREFPAINITTWSEEKLAGVPDLDEIAYSVGIYGCNGKLFHGTDSKFYKITARSANLFRF